VWSFFRRFFFIIVSCLFLFGVPRGFPRGVLRGDSRGGSPGGDPQRFPKGSGSILARFKNDSGLIQGRFWVDSGSILAMSSAFLPRCRALQVSPGSRRTAPGCAGCPQPGRCMVAGCVDPGWPKVIDCPRLAQELPRMALGLASGLVTRLGLLPGFHRPAPLLLPQTSPKPAPNHFQNHPQTIPKPSHNRQTIPKPHRNYPQGTPRPGYHPRPGYPVAWFSPICPIRTGYTYPVTSHWPPREARGGLFRRQADSTAG
jgi:hypothetical protein